MLFVARKQQEFPFVSQLSSVEYLHHWVRPQPFHFESESKDNCLYTSEKFREPQVNLFKSVINLIKCYIILL